MRTMGGCDTRRINASVEGQNWGSTDLQEDVFIDQPLGYVKLGSEHNVYKLKNALYGLKTST